MKTETIDDYSLRLKATEDRLADQEANFISEIDSLKKMIQIYKHHFEEATSKVEELETVINTSQNTINEQIHVIKGKYQKEIEDIKQLWTNDKNKLLEQINLLEAQIQTSITTTAASTTVSTTAATTETTPTTSAAAVGLGSLGPTEMYQRIVETENKLLQEISKKR